MMGLDGDSGLLLSAVDRPEFVREMVEHFSELGCLIAKKVCQDAKIDVVMIGSDNLPIIGPNLIAELFIDAYAAMIETVRACGVDLVALCGRGDLRPLVERFHAVGTNGIEFIAQTKDSDTFDDLIARFGNENFCIGCIDGRVLLGTDSEIEREVNTKIELAQKFRLLPSRHITRILPEVRWHKYRHYVECLRNAIFG